MGGFPNPSGSRRGIVTSGSLVRRSLHGRGPRMLSRPGVPTDSRPSSMGRFLANAHAPAADDWSMRRGTIRTCPAHRPRSSICVTWRSCVVETSASPRSVSRSAARRWAPSALASPNWSACRPVPTGALQRARPRECRHASRNRSRDRSTIEKRRSQRAFSLTILDSDHLRKDHD